MTGKGAHKGGLRIQNKWPARTHEVYRLRATILGPSKELRKNSQSRWDAKYRRTRQIPPWSIR